MPSSGKRPERNPVLGISFGLDQIRVVEVRRAGDELTVTAAGSVAIPAGSLDPGSSIDPDLIAQRLKTVLRKCGATTSHAVLGVPSSGVFTRLLDIPHIPEDELQSVVAGEVAHYQMIRPDGGAFGFAKLPSPENSRDMQVLVMAADDPILHTLDEISKRAGLTTVAKEPSQLASIRAAFQASFREPTLIVSIEEAGTEIAVVDNGRLMLYRRIDVGGRNLLSNAMAFAGAAVGGADTGRPNVTGPTSVDEVLSARLATEVRRSMDYHRRQFPQQDVNQAVIVPMDSRLNPLGDYLEGALGITCRTAVSNVRSAGAAAAELGTPIVPEYFSAIGLAAGELGYASGTLPAINLVPSAPRKAGTAAGSAGLIASVVATAVIVAGGWLYLNQLKSETAFSVSQTNNLKQQAAKLTEELKPKQAKEDAEVKVLSDLSKQGTPFPWVMDAINVARDPGVGISEVHFDGSHIRMSGEAKDEAAMVNTLDNIRSQRTFTSPFVDNFNNQNGSGLTFNLSSDFIDSGAATAINSATTGGPR